MESLKLALRAAAEREGFGLFGVCRPGGTNIDFFEQWITHGHHAEMGYLPDSIPLRADPNSILPGVRSIIAVGLDYRQEPELDPGQPRIARYALGRDYHKVIRAKLKRLALAGGEIAPKAQWRPCVDSAPIFEREYAHLAGLGWFGKNTMLISSRRGSWFFIGLLLTTAEVEPDAPALGGCGTCHKCIDACPTGAILQKNGRWQVDSRLCLSYLTIEHRGDWSSDTQTHGWTFGCDVCQEVCPFNTPRPSQPERAPLTQDRDLLARRPWPSLRQMAEWTEEEWDQATRGSAVRRAGYDGLLRNVRANLADALHQNGGCLTATDAGRGDGEPSPTSL